MIKSRDHVRPHLIQFNFLTDFLACFKSQAFLFTFKLIYFTLIFLLLLSLTSFSFFPIPSPFSLCATNLAISGQTRRRWSLPRPALMPVNTNLAWRRDERCRIFVGFARIARPAGSSSARSSCHPTQPRPGAALAMARRSHSHDRALDLKINYWSKNQSSRPKGQNGNFIFTCHKIYSTPLLMTLRPIMSILSLVDNLWLMLLIE